MIKSAQLVLVALILAFVWVALASAQQRGNSYVVEDFESYRVGELPERWNTNDGRTLVPADQSTMTADHEYRILADGGNRFARATMSDYAYRLIRLNGDGYDWSVAAHPVLSWRWRIQEAPEGAREDDRRKNDVAAAVYVSFDRDWLGRPRSIKYSYSSTLPVGTRISFGVLKVIVVGSAADGDAGEWVTFERDVVRDYEELFGRPFQDDRPIGITLFSDADDVPAGKAVADFDDIVLQTRFKDSRITKDHK